MEIETFDDEGQIDVMPTTIANKRRW
jgi:hypothetical protein